MQSIRIYFAVYKGTRYILEVVQYATSFRKNGTLPTLNIKNNENLYHRPFFKSSLKLLFFRI